MPSEGMMKHLLASARVCEKVALIRLELLAERLLSGYPGIGFSEFCMTWEYFCRWPVVDKVFLCASPGARDWTERGQRFFDQGVMDRYPDSYFYRHLKHFCSLFLSCLSTQSPPMTGVTWPVMGDKLPLSRGLLTLQSSKHVNSPLSWEFRDGDLRVADQTGCVAVVQCISQPRVKFVDSDWKCFHANCVEGMPVGVDSLFYRNGNIPEQVPRRLLEALSGSYRALTDDYKQLASHLVHSIGCGTPDRWHPGHFSLPILLEPDSFAAALEGDIERRIKYIEALISPAKLNSRDEDDSDIHAPHETDPNAFLLYDFTTLPSIRSVPSAVGVHKTRRVDHRSVDWSLVDIVARLSAHELNSVLRSAALISRNKDEATAFLRAACHYCLKEYQECRSQLRSCLAHSYETEEYWTLFAFCCRHEGKYEEFESIIYKDPLRQLVS